MTSLGFLDLYNIISGHFCCSPIPPGFVLGFRGCQFSLCIPRSLVRDGPGLSKYMFVVSDSV